MNKHTKVYLNRNEFGTVSGIKFIELHYADLTEFYYPIDLLVLASYKYHEGSTQKAFEKSFMEKYGMSMKEIQEEAALDLNKSLGVWMSKEFDVEKVGFKRIACIELDDRTITAECFAERIRNLFAVINLADGIGINIENIAMPVMGSCLKNLPDDEILSILVGQSRFAMEKTYNLDGIYIVDNDRERVMKFDRKMNEILNRTDVDQENVFSDEQCDEILCDMWSKMKYYREQVTSGKFKKRDRSDVLIEFEARIESRELRQFEFCVLARKMLEFIIYDIGGDKAGNRNLFQRIEYMRKAELASPRITAYMHIIRAFGNAEVHTDEEVEYSIEENYLDRQILVECLSRVVDYWIAYKYRSNKKIK